MQSRRRGTMSGDAAETRPMDRTLACGCRFLRGSVFPCDAHQGGSLIRALLDELDRRRGTMTDDDHECPWCKLDAAIDQLAERDADLSLARHDYATLLERWREEQQHVLHWR